TPAGERSLHRISNSVIRSERFGRRVSNIMDRSGRSHTGIRQMNSSISWPFVWMPISIRAGNSMPVMSSGSRHRSTEASSRSFWDAGLAAGDTIRSVQIFDEPFQKVFTLFFAGVKDVVPIQFRLVFAQIECLVKNRFVR